MKVLIMLSWAGLYLFLFFIIFRLATGFIHLLLQIQNLRIQFRFFLLEKLQFCLLFLLSGKSDFPLFVLGLFKWCQASVKSISIVE